MANCPKCGRKLHIYDWRPECPGCHVNLVYYNSNENLLAESEKAEIEHAKSQPSIDRAKAAFFGSAPAIIRIILSLLPIAGLFLPVCILDGSKKVTAIDIYNYISKADIGALFGGITKGDVFPVSIVLLLLSVVMILVCLGCLVMSLGPHGKQRNFILNMIMLLSAIGSALTFAFADVSKSLPAYKTGKLGVGIFVYIGLVAVLLIYNLYLAKKGLKIKHTLCLIGGLPSDEYFKMVESGVSELEIRKKMVEALTKMQNEVRAKAAKEEEEALKKAMERK